MHHFRSCISKSSYFWFIIFKISSKFHAMTSTYAIIEDRIQKTIEVINTRKNSNRAKIAREFLVSCERLRSRLRDYQFKTAVRELELGLSVRLHLLQSTTNSLRAQNFSRWNFSSLLSDNWVKRWLDQQSDLFKAKRKSLAAERKNAHDSKVLQTHLDGFKEIREAKFLILENWVS